MKRSVKNEFSNRTRTRNGRWIAEIDALNGVLVYSETREEAIKKVKILALQVIADRLENINQNQ